MPNPNGTGTKDASLAELHRRSDESDPLTTAAPEATGGWNGLPFPEKAERLTLPDGRLLEDAIIWPDFCQDQLRLDPAKLFQELLDFPTWPSTEPIPFRQKGDNPHWISGTHRALHYRGNALKRGKIWCQSDYASGLRRYRYPGWQYRISLATHAVEFVPPVQRLAERLNAGLIRSGHTPHNHWIVTRYEDENENIGFHSDNDPDFAENSYFIVIKLGEARPFAFRLPGAKAPFLTRTLSAGTAVFVRCKALGAANDLVQHGVPPIDIPVGLSGSIVSRCIETLIPWDRVKREVEKRERKHRSVSVENDPSEPQLADVTSGTGEAKRHANVTKKDINPSLEGAAPRVDANMTTQKTDPTGNEVPTEYQTNSNALAIVTNGAHHLTEPQIRFREGKEAKGLADALKRLEAGRVHAAALTLAAWARITSGVKAVMVYISDVTEVWKAQGCSSGSDYALKYFGLKQKNYEKHQHAGAAAMVYYQDRCADFIAAMESGDPINIGSLPDLPDVSVLDELSRVHKRVLKLTADPDVAAAQMVIYLARVLENACGIEEVQAWGKPDNSADARHGEDGGEDDDEYDGDEDDDGADNLDGVVVTAATTAATTAAPVHQVPTVDGLPDDIAGHLRALIAAVDGFASSARARGQGSLTSHAEALGSVHAYAYHTVADAIRWLVGITPTPPGPRSQSGRKPEQLNAPQAPEVAESPTDAELPTAMAPAPPAPPAAPAAPAPPPLALPLATANESVADARCAPEDRPRIVAEQAKTMSAKAQRVVDYLRENSGPVKIRIIATACFPSEADREKAESWVRNSFRQPVAHGLVEQVARGTYIYVGPRQAADSRAAVES